MKSSQNNYRIQHRLMSPDVIEKRTIIDGKEKWKVYICPIGSRSNDVANKLIKHLNNGTIL